MSQATPARETSSDGQAADAAAGDDPQLGRALEIVLEFRPGGEFH